MTFLLWDLQVRLHRLKLLGVFDRAALPLLSYLQFCISFIERRLLRLCPHAGINIGNQRLLTVSYADDLTVLCTNKAEAASVFSVL